MTLRCPGCGAPSRDASTRCEYCRARLATVSCPACFALLFDGSAFCPHCGAARNRVAADAATRSRCPACRGDMSWIAVGDVDLLECGTCDGTWIEAAAFERVCASRESQAAVLHAVDQARSADGQAGGAAAPKTPEYRPCLRCGKLMNRVNFGRRSGTVVDVCRGHGTFLDRGELHGVVRFVQDGGLDRTRRAEIEELREEQRRLSALERHAERSVPPAGRFAWDERWFRDFLSALLDRR